MRLARVRAGTALLHDGEIRVLTGTDGPDLDGPALDRALQAGALPELADRIRREGVPVPEEDLEFLPLLGRSSKIVCVGLNYVDHAVETAFEVPALPTVFPRFTSSLVGHGQPLRMPGFSEQLDFEGELAAVIGTAAHAVDRRSALDHVLGYSLFNDATVRDLQFATPQWTLGKNVDGIGRLTNPVTPV